MEPEAIDDAQLLSAIELAWPVPPMTGRLINRDVSGLAIDPQTGSFSAPLALPRIKTNRRWSSLTRVAAVLALLLTSVFGVIAFNNRSEENPTYSIAAPSPYESSCSLPLRSRDELTQIVTEIKAQIDAGTLTTMGNTHIPQDSVFEVTVDTSDSNEAVSQFVTEVLHCVALGINPARLESYGRNAYVIYITQLFGTPNLSVKTAVSDLMEPYPYASTPVAEDYQQVQTELLVTNGGVLIAALQPDIFGNRYGYEVSRTGNDWIFEGLRFVSGEWGSLNAQPTLSSAYCPASSIRDEVTLQTFISNQSWESETRPLLADLVVSNSPGLAVDSDEIDAVNRVLDDFRACSVYQIEPYRFAESTEAFFGIFANFANAGPDASIQSFRTNGAFDFRQTIPADVGSMVKLDASTILATLNVNPEWASTGKVPAIILVNVDGQWLINQLAIVQTAMAATPQSGG